MSARASNQLELALEGMTCAACATRIEKVLNRVPGADMDVLIGLSTSMAYFFGAVVTLWKLPHHVYFEASAAIITLILMGKLLEARARGRTSAAIEALIKLQPRTALVERNGQLV